VNVCTEQVRHAAAELKYEVCEGLSSR
jgi:hypothetical protein